MIDVIVCVKNPNPKLFNKCLTQINQQNFLHDIIIVLAKDDNFEHNEKNIKVIKEPEHSCLAYARKLGIDNSTSKFICFVDADVVLHKNHFKLLLEAYKDCNHPNMVIEGVLQIIDPTIRFEYKPYEYKELVLGERGFTHNTLIPRKIVKNWSPPYTHAYEDYHLTQYILKNGGRWIRFPQRCLSYHIKDYHILKRSLWGNAGRRIVMNPSKLEILKETLNYLKRALLHPFVLRNNYHFVYNIILAYASMVGYFSYQRYMRLE